MIRHNFKTKKGNRITIIIDVVPNGQYRIIIEKNHFVIFDGRCLDPSDTFENPDPPEVDYSKLQKDQQFDSLIRSITDYVKNTSE